MAGELTAASPHVSPVNQCKTFHGAACDPA